MALELRIHDGAPSFMVTDAADSPWAHHELLGTMLPRAGVIGTPLATEIFALVDVIYLEDVRLAQFLGGRPGAISRSRVRTALSRLVRLLRD